MPRNIVQDIIVRRRPKKTASVPNTKPRRAARQKPIREETVIKKSRNKRKLGVSKKGIIILVFIGAILVVLFSFSSKVVIAVTPKYETANIDFKTEIKKETDEQQDGLSYTVLTLEEEREQQIPSTGTKEVDKRASGNIIVFNNYSTASKRLISRTRFETPDGKVYRIRDAIVVPGYKQEDGKKVAGTVEATVYADMPGEEYNTGFTDFTVPGLKGTPLYGDIFARSKTEIEGGFSGTMNIVSDEDMLDAREKLEKESVSALYERMGRIISDENIVYDGGVFIEFNEETSSVPATESGDESALYSLHTRVYAVVLNREDLSKSIEGKYVATDQSGRLVLDNIDKLVLVVENKDLVDMTEVQSLQITVSGDASFKWLINEDEIKTRLLGKGKDEVEFKRVFLENFPNISSADVQSFRPFWARKFPDDPDNIEIIEKEADNGST